MEILLYAYALLCAVGLVQTALMFVFQYEQHRYYCSRLRSTCDLGWVPRVSLFVPCKGLDLDLEANLEKLFQQDYPNYELCFIVETLADPAHAVIQRLRKRFSTPSCRVLVAGIATDCGQKVHNLASATRQVPGDVEVLAFADSDARPHRNWLARLVQRLQNDKIGASTGYRWFLPRKITAPNWIACGINSQVAGLMGSHRLNLVWGGAWAIRATTFRQLGLPDAWRGSLSDDLVVSRLIHAARLKVAFEPHCLATSPVEFDWTTLGEFVRRQFLVVRVYAPRWWLSAFCASSFALLWLLTSCMLTMFWSQDGGPLWLPATWGTLHVALMDYRLALRTRTIAPFVQADRDTVRSLSRREVFGWPLIAVCYWLGLVASAFGRTIRWRSITYRLTSQSQTDILHRPRSTPGLCATVSDAIPGRSDGTSGRKVA